MRPTPEQILSFLDKANKIRDIHEVLPSDDPEAAKKAIVEVFYERFLPAPTMPVQDANTGEWRITSDFNDDLKQERKGT